MAKQKHTALVKGVIDVADAGKTVAGAGVSMATTAAKVVGVAAKIAVWPVGKALSGVAHFASTYKRTTFVVLAVTAVATINGAYQGYKNRKAERAAQEPAAPLTGETQAAASASMPAAATEQEMNNAPEGYWAGREQQRSASRERSASL